MTRLKLGVLISGRGSNLQALIDAAADPDYPSEIAVVVSNEPDAYGLERARAAAIPTAVVDHRDFPDRPSFEAALDRQLEAAGAELVCLAGFLRLLTETFVARWRDRLINIHPSLLPSFRGLHVHRKAIAYGARFAGCTVHFVRPAMDDGPIILQAAVPIDPADDEDALAARVLAQEHVIYPLAVRLYAEGRLKIVDERVEISDAVAPDGALICPRC